MSTSLNYILPLPLLAVNVIAFSFFGVDKRRAARRQWRIFGSYLI